MGCRTGLAGHPGAAGHRDPKLSWTPEALGTGMGCRAGMRLGSETSEMLSPERTAAAEQHLQPRDHGKSAGKGLKPFPALQWQLQSCLSLSETFESLGLLGANYS